MAKKIPKIVKEIQRSPKPEINYSFNKSISYSQLQLYNSCPLKWSLLYKEGYKAFTSSIHSIFGTAIHKVLQRYISTMYGKSSIAADTENVREYFEEVFREEYKNQYKSNKNQHFSSSEELREFYDDGLKIIEFFIKKRNRYFTKRGWYLVGCELPVTVIPNPKYKNVFYKGLLDLVMYHEPTETFKIIDIKSSTRGWGEKAKKDENKQFQLILYKKFFSQQYGIPLDKIEIEFFILKRKPFENPDFPLFRIQSYSPPSGKIKLRKATDLLNNFIEETFTTEGKYKEREFDFKVSPLCKYCPFDKNSELCPK